MTALNRLCTSSDGEVVIETLRVSIGSEVYYSCKRSDDITATIENGDTVTSLTAAIDITLPARNSDGTQDLQFVVNNIGGITSTVIRNTLDNPSGVSLIYCNCVSIDLSASASVSYTLAIKSGS